jgi:hypothetical protein
MISLDVGLSMISLHIGLSMISLDIELKRAESDIMLLYIFEAHVYGHIQYMSMPMFIIHLYSILPCVQVHIAVYPYEAGPVHVHMVVYPCARGHVSTWTWPCIHVNMANGYIPLIWDRICMTQRPFPDVQCTLYIHCRNTFTSVLWKI